MCNIEFDPALRLIEAGLNNFYDFDSIVFDQTCKTFLNQDATKCRYCSNERPGPHFRNESHIISRQIGNKYVYASDECDVCNNYYSETLEKCLGVYTLIDRVFRRFGPKVSYRSNDKNLTIRPQEDGISLESFKENNLVKFDDSTGILSIEYDKRRFIPRNLYKCLTKFAIALTPADELSYFNDTINWIRNNSSAQENQAEHRKLLCTKYYSSKIHTKNIVVIFLTRKTIADSLPYPYKLFVIFFDSFGYQIHLPFCSKDAHLTDGLIELFYPGPFTEMVNGIPVHETLDWTSNEFSSDEKDIINLITAERLPGQGT